MFKRITILACALFFFITSISFAAGLPETGQKKCYDASGTEIACTGTGQDGEFQAGFGSSNPRFKKIYCDASGPCANQGGDCDGNASTDMIKDNLTGLIWPRNGNLPTTTKYWADALPYSNDLTLCGYSDWRLPNVNELGSLYNSGQSDLNAWLISQGFINVYTHQYPGYWSSTSVDTTTGPGVGAWVLEGGSIIGSPKSRQGIDLRYVWPVRGTTAGPTQLPQTGQATCYDATGTVISCAGTGQDGELKEGSPWPVPRFTAVYCGDNGPCADPEFDCDTSDSNNVMLDNLTGLVWTKDANLPAGTRQWADALTYANDASVCGYTDWRIPNREEFRSLANYGTSDLPVWLNVEGGFINVPLQTNNCLYWTSTTTSALYTTDAWIFRIRVYPYSNEYLYGSVVPMGKTQSLYVWPVRGGCIAHFADFDPATFWAAGYIKNLYCKGITTGYPDNTYRPADFVSRSQMAAFIIRAKFGESFSYSSTQHFSDIPNTHWAFKYVQKMYDEGITTGYADGTYRPSENVARSQMAAFIIRAKFGESFSYSLTPYFTDIPDTHWAFKYVQKMYDEGITTGYADGTYRPSQNVGRAQMATFIARAFLGMP